MSKKTTFLESGRWYKGNTHLHTTMSDGQLDPAQAVAVYRNTGYSFTVITDHWYYGNHKELGSEDFLVFAGMEMDISFSLGERKGLCHHVTVMANPEETPYKTGDRLEEVRGLKDMSKMVEHMNSTGHLCIYAHPRWSQIKIEEYDIISGCIGMEVYNNVCELEAGCGYAETYFDREMWKPKSRLCFASDDAHGRGHYLGGFICVKADRFTYKGIMDAIRAGSFYSSNGPEIFDFYVEDGAAYIKCSPCSDIVFFTDAAPGSRVVRNSPGSTEASYIVPQGATCIYAVCKNGSSRAWTQIIRL
jgi:hypothetical protein